MPSVRPMLILLLGVALGAPAVLRGQQSDTLLVFAVPVELQTLSPEVERVFVDCVLTHLYPSAATDTIGFARGEAVVERGRFGGSVSDVVEVAFTLSDVQGDPRTPEGNACWLIIQSAGGKESEPESPADPAASAVPEWAWFLNPSNCAGTRCSKPTIVSGATLHPLYQDKMVELWRAAIQGRNNQ